MSNLKSRNKPSLLLSSDENNSIFSQFESGETSLATAVIQLVLSGPPDHNRWQLFNTGVMCFVKQNRKRSYFFQLYDFDLKEKLWENEIYLNINYISVEPKFHTFEAEDCMAGLSFADETEAENFLTIVKQKIKFLNKMFGLNDMNNKTEYKKEVINLEVPQTTTLRTRSLESLKIKKKFTFRMKSSKKSKTAKLNKLEIGLPTNFKHIQHIGWNPSTGFDFNVIDPKLHNFFSLAGISDHHLQDTDTRKFIFDFIDKHGGIETAIREVDQPIKNKSNLKFDESLKVINKYTKDMTKTEFTAPPPPPPVTSVSSTFSNATPPPPPPPPPPVIFTHTSDSNIEIESNPNKFEDRKSELNMSCDRNEFLEQIRGGVRLKRAETSKNKTNSVETHENCGNTLATALSKALQNRFRVNQINDNSSEDSEDNNICEETEFNEWSD